MGSTATEAIIPLAQYLWTRVRQLGVQSIMGLPGDMNLELLDYIKEVEGLRWVGNANELNAAYAADGYARVKNVPGVIVTTMGVGELSAINGIAGAYTEEVKVIHIVGTTGTAAQKNRLMIHHCLGSDPDHRIYEKMSTRVRCAHAWLDDAATAAKEVDRVFRECYIKSLPVYLFVPMDYVHIPVNARRLQQPIDLAPPVNQVNQEKAVRKIFEALRSARKPVVLVDCLAARHNARDETNQLVQVLELPTFATPMGKTIVDETYASYHGIYNGTVSYPGIKAAVEGSDCLLNIGPLLSDSNSGGHTRDVRAENVILIGSNTCIVFGETYHDVYLKPFVKCLLEHSSRLPLPLRRDPNFKLPPRPQPEDLDSKLIRQSWIWERLGNFARPGDIVIGESGTAQFGFSDAAFPQQTKYITQLYFGCIGYSVGCCLGAALAQRELQQAGTAQPGRTILIVGDGSLQLTVQEVGTMIKLGLAPIIIVINSKGFTIERAIHGPEEAYNDIATWNYQALLEFFGAKNGRRCSREVRTKDEMETVLLSDDYVSPKEIQLLEVHMDVMDIPWRLAHQIEIINQRMAAAKRVQAKRPVPVA